MIQNLSEVVAEINTNIVWNDDIPEPAKGINEEFEAV
jgi:hypothetical protein